MRGTSRGSELCERGRGGGGGGRKRRLDGLNCESDV